MTGEKIISWMYKWLPAIMGCHCRKERSFSYKGRPFPICARCTGELAGFLLALIFFPVFKTPWYWLLLLLLPAIIDGTIQLKTSYESNNIRRLWTGLLLGFGLMSLFLCSARAVLELGMKFGLKLK